MSLWCFFYKKMLGFLGTTVWRVRMCIYVRSCTVWPSLIQSLVPSGLDHATGTNLSFTPSLCSIVLFVVFWICTLRVHKSGLLVSKHDCNFEGSSSVISFCSITYGILHTTQTLNIIFCTKQTIGDWYSWNLVLNFSTSSAKGIC